MLLYTFKNKLTSVISTGMVILFACSFFNLNAQMTFSPEYFQVEIANEDTKKFGYLLENVSNDVFNWFWSVELPDDFPPEWEVQICDTNLCYNWGNFKSPNNMPNEMAVGAVTNPQEQYVNIRSNGVSGTSYVIFNVYGDIDCQDLIYSTSTTSSFGEVEQPVSFEVFPNPSQLGFQITNDQDVTRIGMTSSSGELIQSQKHNPGDMIDVSEMSEGLYLITLYNRRNQILGSEWFVKVAN